MGSEPPIASPLVTFAERIRAASAFFRAFVAAPGVVGAALPSSRSLALALMEPLRERTGPARILEVGAGTGAVTRHLVHEIAEGDRLAICEIRPDLMKQLQRTVLGNRDAFGKSGPRRIVLHTCSVQELSKDQPFDYIVSGLPFTAFSADAVREMLDHIRGLLRPGGVFSYFEYIALRRLRGWASLRDGRARMKELSALLDATINDHQFRRSTVVANFPPAYARHLRFARV